MGTIASTPVTALSVLTAPGAPLASGSSLIPQSILSSASPADLSSLSSEASALAEETGLLGLPTPDYGQSTPNFFQSIDSSITNAAFGLAPAALAATSTTPPSLDQLVASYSGETNNTGTVVNTTG
jgi:hypothetical protein